MSDVSRARGLDFSATLADGRLPAVVHRNRLSLSGWIAALVAADIAGSISFAWITFQWYAAPRGHDWAQLGIGVASFVVAWILVSSALKLYEKEMVLSELKVHWSRGVTSCALSFGVTLLLGFMLQFIGEMSRVWFLSWAAAEFVWVGGVRIAWSRHLTGLFRQGRCVDRALVLGGSPEQIDETAGAVQRESRGHIGVVFTAGIPETAHGSTSDWIEQLVRRNLVDRVIIAGFENVVPETQCLLERLTRSAVDVTVIPSLIGLQGKLTHVNHIGTLPTIDLSLRPLSAVQLALKRAEDLVLAGIVLAITSAIFLIICIAIKLDSPGPIFFRQDREGYHYQTFRAWKFRTMFDNARDPGAVRQTSRNDSRVTRVGRWLRRLSLDELPQIINVFRGDMSLVGPRPHPLSMTTDGQSMQHALDEYSARYRLKPGITGLAQVSGCRGEIDSREKLRRRVSLDCYYIDNWSLSLDLWIILRTIALVIFDSDAY